MDVNTQLHLNTITVLHSHQQTRHLTDKIKLTKKHQRSITAKATAHQMYLADNYRISHTNTAELIFLRIRCNFP